MDSPPLDASCTIRSVPGVLSREVGDELVLLNLADGRYFSLNATGLSVWKRLASATTVAAVAEALVAEYEESHDRLREEILDLVRELERQGLVERSS